MGLLGKRKNFLINPAFQWLMIKWFLLLSVFTSAIFYFSHHLFFQELKSMGLTNNLPQDAAYFKFIEQQELRLEYIFLICTIFSVILIVGFGVYVSHRIAGPIFRICQYLVESDQNLSHKLTFREDDFFPELAQAINQHLSKENSGENQKGR